MSDDPSNTTTSANQYELSHAIIDNINHTVGQRLRDCIQSDSSLSIVSAYFTIYAYEALRKELEGVRNLRFLYGDPTGINKPDPSNVIPTHFRLTQDNGIELSHSLAQKAIARECKNWIERRVEIRTIRQTNFLHGKLYHIESDKDSVTIVGSSNFTKSGLGEGHRSNVELNLDVRAKQDRDSLLAWFDDLWEHESYTEDVKQAVLEELDRLIQPFSPRFIYYKTLYHIFKDDFETYKETQDSLHGVHLLNTQIWGRLYSFQKTGAKTAINRLKKFNGCIIADSVGLGKTWTALAVIKYFELQSDRVLVLCPKRLENNWVRYTARAGQYNNPFDKDQFDYTVLAHTDLSRYEGFSGQIDLGNFNWGMFKLIVIDESHNFRNISQDSKDESGNLIRHSRYNRLLEHVIKAGVNSKLLLLSATPVNTSLQDLRNQIYLITKKRDGVFRDLLGISNLQHMFKVAQQAFVQWQRRENQDKSTLLNNLGGDFLSLLDATSIARSRRHIQEFYSDDMSDIKGFPRRLAPINLDVQTDSQGEFSYDALHNRLDDFKLSVYSPSEYLVDRSSLNSERIQWNYDQGDRERALVGMMRVNLLKRLESSVAAFTLTTERILKKMESILEAIQRFRDREIDEEIEPYPNDDDDDDEFLIGMKRKYKLKDLDIQSWELDLLDDMKVFSELLTNAMKVTVDRDEKLIQLKAKLKEKVSRANSNDDEYSNKKAIVFTTFADTANYLYENLEDWVCNTLGLNIALVTGSQLNKSSTGTTQFREILERFAPKGQETKSKYEEIDILIATDCISEGQNLQDCDLIVNYDIHWNPVRLMQRFGRIDRLNSDNATVSMINFWPTDDLESYLNLKYRVEARAALADACATGMEDPLNTENFELNKKSSTVDLKFRDRQLLMMRDEILDIEEGEDNIAMNDFTLDDFIAELLQYMEENSKELENAPLGVFAVADINHTSNQIQDFSSVSPGAIFCLRNTSIEVPQNAQQLSPYFLIYVCEDGRVFSSILQAKQCLSLLRYIASGKSDSNKRLEDVFNRSTLQGRQLHKYDTLLKNALKHIDSAMQEREMNRLTKNREGLITNKTDTEHDWELVTWLVILENKTIGSYEG